jgi:WD40 repeat protein
VILIRTEKKRILVRILFFFLITGNLIIPSLFLNHILQNKSWVYSLTNDYEEYESSIAISDDGNYLVVGSANDNLYLFNKWSAIPVWTYKMQYDISGVDISSDGNYIVAGVRNEELYLFNRNYPIPIWINESAGGGPVSISQDGSIILSSPGRIYIFHKSSPNPLWINSYGGSWSVISNKGNYISTVDPDRNLNFYSINNSDPIWSFAQGDFTLKIAISSNGEYLCAGGQDRYFYLFNNSDMNPKTPMWSYKSSNYIRTVAISSDGFYSIAGTTQGVHLFVMNNSNPIMTNNLLGEVISLDMSSDGQYYCVGVASNAIYLFDQNNSTPIITYNPNRRVPSVKISANGNYFIASTGYKFYLFDRVNPVILEESELSLNVIFGSVWVFLSLDIIPGLVSTLKACIIFIKKLPYRKLEKRKREVEKTYTILDKEFEKWEKEDPKKESKG